MLNSSPCRSAYVSFFLSPLLLLCSSLIFLDQGLTAQAQVVPSRAETIAARLRLLEIGTRARLRLFEEISPIDRPPDFQYDLYTIQNNLNQANQTTGLKTALIYIFFAPHSSDSRDKDTLEVIMINGEGEPLRVQFLDVTRHQILAVVNDLGNSSIYLPRPDDAAQGSTQDNNNLESININRFGEAQIVRSVTLDRNILRTRLTVSSGIGDPRFNMNAAQQIYQWLLAPLESELQRYSINNLVFVLDDKLGFLPLETIHGGQRFLRERYILSRPSQPVYDGRRFLRE